MLSSKAIKGKIRSVDKTHQVTKAMGAVSAVKMRKSQERALASRPYALHALTVFQRVSASADVSAHPLAARRDLRRLLLVVFSSDKGLAGSFNAKVIRKAEEAAAASGLPRDAVDVIAVGRKGAEYFGKRGWRIAQALHGSTALDDEERLREFVADIARRFTDGACDAVRVAYTNFRSTFQQEAVVRNVLPLDPEALSELVFGIAPERGRYAEVFAKKGISRETAVYTFEPSAKEVLAEVLPFLLAVEIRHAILESRASEHSARMVAMKNASDKAAELSETLRLQYNKERQSAITRELSEIVGGAEALTT